LYSEIAEVECAPQKLFDPSLYKQRSLGVLVKLQAKAVPNHEAFGGFSTRFKTRHNWGSAAKIVS